MLIVRVYLSVQNKCPASSMDRMNGYGPFDERSNRSWGTNKCFFEHKLFIIIVVMENFDFIEQLRKEANSCRNMYELCIKLGINSIGGNTYREIRKIAQENSIELNFSHINKNSLKSTKKLYLQDLLVDGSKIKSNALKEKLINAGIKGCYCECCRNTEWLGKPIPLELHHINGKNDDNRLENLQILCRNCHGQTDNFCGKNTKSRRSLREKTNGADLFSRIDKDYLNQLLCTKPLNECALELDVSIYCLKYWLKKLGIKPDKIWKEEKCKEYHRQIGTCENCGVLFIKKSSKQKYCSEACSHAASRVTDVTENELIVALKKYKSFLSTAKYFGVSDKCIVKWCR